MYYPNSQDDSRGRGRQNPSRTGGQSVQGQRGQPSPMDVDGGFAHSSFPGSGVVNSPAFSPPGLLLNNQGNAWESGISSPMQLGMIPETFYPNQVSQQHNPAPSFAPPVMRSNSNDGRRSSSRQYRDSASISGSSGPYTSNPLPAHISQPTPAIPIRQPRHREERSYSTGEYPTSSSLTSSYGVADRRDPPPPAIRITGEPLPSSWSPAIQNTVPKSAPSRSGRVDSQNTGSGPHFSTSYTSTHQNQSYPLCKVPRCGRPVVFDPCINEKREFCEEHIGQMIPSGFAGRCVTCQKMPARLDSEFCSEACRNMGDVQMGPPSKPTGTVPPGGVQRSFSGGGVSPVVPQAGTKRKNEVPDGLGPTCQECRRHITSESRIASGSRYCSKRCEEYHSSKSRRL